MITKENILSFLSNNKNYFKERYHIARIGIFGSYSRNEYSNDSDIDVIIEFDENIEHVFDAKYELKEFLQNHFNKSIDLCREKSLNKLFYKKIIEEAIYV